MLISAFVWLQSPGDPGANVVPRVAVGFGLGTVLCVVLRTGMAVRLAK